MVTRETCVVNSLGIHARPASNLVTEAKRFSSKIKIENLEKSSIPAVNAKSIMQVLTLTAKQGDRIRINADGDDANEAVEAIVALVDSGLGE